MVIFIVIFALPGGEPLHPFPLIDAVDLLARSSPPISRLEPAEAMIQRPSLRIISGAAVGRAIAALALGRAHVGGTDGARS
jgi:hypothetical protein